MTNSERGNFKVKLAIVFAVFIGLEAHAGNGTHGGNVVICPAKPAVTLDYYHAKLATLDGKIPVLVDIGKMSKNEVVEFGLNRVKDYIELGTLAREVRDLIGDTDKWLTADLKQVDDSNEPYVLPAGCHRQTAAVRQGFREHAVMYGDPTVMKLLSPAQKGILVLHEIFYFISSLNHQETSEHVRDLMRILLKEKFADEDLDQVVAGLGLKDARNTCGIRCMNGLTFRTSAETEYGYQYQYGYKITEVNSGQHSFRATFVDPLGEWRKTSGGGKGMKPEFQSLLIKCKYDYGDCIIQGLDQKNFLAVLIPQTQYSNMSTLQFQSPLLSGLPVEKFVSKGE